jgi:phosphoribosylformylglycinamidine cyclo-ligase
LLGGETAEMPGFYPVGEYDVAGFSVGIVEKTKLLDGSKINIGDIVIGLSSSGVHSNGFSLVRKIVEVNDLDWGDRFDLLGEKTLGEVLLTPTKIYVKPILDALKSDLEIKGMAHITGGGLPENLPRCLREGQAIKINPKSWDILPIFQWIAEMGKVEISAMFDTFNMGIGFVIIVPETNSEHTIKWLKNQDISAYEIGEIIEGNGELIGL